MDEWRKIVGFPEYEIHSDGTIRSWRVSLSPVPNRRSIPYIMEGSRTEAGYQQFMLRKPGETRPHRRQLHRILAEAFLVNPDGLPDVAHNDGDAGNSALPNLRWATHRDNQMDMRKHGTMQDGEKCCTVKITEEQARDIIVRAFTGELQKDLAVEFSLSRAQVSRIVNGKRWASLAIESGRPVAAGS